jgi:hypothetical protein
MPLLVYKSTETRGIIHDFTASAFKLFIRLTKTRDLGTYCSSPTRLRVLVLQTASRDRSVALPCFHLLPIIGFPRVPLLEASTWYCTRGIIHDYGMLPFIKKCQTIPNYAKTIK